MACLYYGGIASTAKREAASVALTLAAGLVFAQKAAAFPTLQDETHFWASLCVSVASLCCGGGAADACVFALAGLAGAIYRTPENPYASILCLILSIRLWSKVLLMSSTTTTTTSYCCVDAADLVITMLYACYTIEVALIPQFTHPEDWPIYGGCGAYVSFAAAWYQKSKTRL